MEEQANRLYLAGELSDPPVFSHECCGVTFYLFQMSVLRKSGVADSLPVLCEESRLPVTMDTGMPLTVTGQLRAYSRHTMTGSRQETLAGFGQGFARFALGLGNTIQTCFGL